MIKFAKIMNKEDWNEVWEKNGIKIYSRRHNGTVGILTEKVIDIPV